MNGNQVISLLELKNYLCWNMSDSSKDEFFDSIIDAISQLMEDYCSTRLKESTVSETISGDGSHLLILSNRHVTSLLSLKFFNGSEFEDIFSTPEEMNQVAVYRGKFLYLRRGFFEKGIHNYEVSYVCGYSEIPADLKMIALEMCALAFQNSFHGESRLGLLADRIANIKMFFLEELPMHRAVLLKYMNVKV